MSQAIRDGYHELFERNEYAHELTKDKLVGLVTEITGASKDDSTTKCTVSTFNALKEFADFEAQPEEETEEVTRAEQRAAPLSLPDEQPRRHAQQAPDDVNLAVSYTINLNLPETTNPEVFNAIFRALKENLLGRS